MVNENDGPPALPTQVSALLVDLWSKIQGDEQAVARVNLREIARQISTHAHATGFLPEDVIIAVKDSWLRAGSMRRASEVHRLRLALEQVVALCIEEYYRYADDVRPQERTMRRRPTVDPPPHTNPS